ncbi:MAG: SlyX family protein [Candidatus Omnitrophica bacterium]|nr:SlyX family protein [Candidatus Omnitrophota bacterium]
MMQQRLTELERKTAYQDKLLQELNEVVFGLSKRLDQLESRQKAMNNQLTSGNLVQRQEDETPPPHY